MQTLYGKLQSEGHTLIVRQGGNVYTFRRRGIADLLDLLQQRPELLRGADVADRVVGRAAAALMVLGGVARLYTGVASKAAVEMLRMGGVAFTAETLVDGIRNRRGDGPCPMEAATANATTAEAALPLILNKFKELNK